MKQRFYIYRRGETFYMQDSRTGKQQSLETKDRKAALRLLEIKRQTAVDPGFNQFILKSCLTTQDPLLGKGCQGYRELMLTARLLRKTAALTLPPMSACHSA